MDTKRVVEVDALRIDGARLWQSLMDLAQIGATAKIRDAEIRLTQGTTSAAKTNVGFVPLLHLHAGYQFSHLFELLTDIDGLVAPQGRAEDIAVMAGYRPIPGLQIRIGYRTVEGGSDGEGSGKVYNFAWLHDAIINLAFDL